MKARLLVVSALFLLAGALTLPAPGYAKKGSPSVVVQTEVEAELAPCCGSPEPGAEGESERSTRTVDGILQSDRFGAEVEIPVPSASADLGITDATAAAAADIRLVLSRGGTDYAECFLPFDEIETALEDGLLKTTATFQVDFSTRLQKGVLVTRHRGDCDVDLASLGTQSGLPDVQAGDVATVSFMKGGARTPFLDGTFVVHH